MNTSRAHPFQYFTLDEYTEFGCMQMEAPIGPALWVHMRGKMCNGCPKYQDGRCDSLNKMLAARKSLSVTATQSSGETVRQEAARRGLSISEVRRQRNATANGGSQ